MNPEQKAEYLFLLFYTPILTKEQVKQLSLIATEECLKVCPYSQIEYWFNVKKEIKKL